MDLSTIPTAALIAELTSRTSTGRALRCAEIVAATSSAFDLSPLTIFTKNRRHPCDVARQVSMALTRELTNHSYPVIAKYFGLAHHGSVILAVKRLPIIELDPAYADTLHTIRIDLAERLKVSKTSV